MDQPLFNQDCLLEKVPGKGGWTYAVLPGVPKEQKGRYGHVQVKGSIDGFLIHHYNLMPMANGKLFLPVKATIRKAIRKEAGDTVRVILYPDNDPLSIPGEFLTCLSDDPSARKQFFRFTESEQKAYIEWIYSAKKESVRIDRMAAAINRIALGQKYYDQT